MPEITTAAEQTLPNTDSTSRVPLHPPQVGFLGLVVVLLLPEQETLWIAILGWFATLLFLGVLIGGSYYGKPVDRRLLLFLATAFGIIQASWHGQFIALPLLPALALALSVGTIIGTSSELVRRSAFLSGHVLLMLLVVVLLHRLLWLDQLTILLHGSGDDSRFSSQAQRSLFFLSPHERREALFQIALRAGTKGDTVLARHCLRRALEIELKDPPAGPSRLAIYGAQKGFGYVEDAEKTKQALNLNGYEDRPPYTDSDWILAESRFHLAQKNFDRAKALTRSLADSRLKIFELESILHSEIAARNELSARESFAALVTHYQKLNDESAKLHLLALVQSSAASVSTGDAQQILRMNGMTRFKVPWMTAASAVAAQLLKSHRASEARELLNEAVTLVSSDITSSERYDFHNALREVARLQREAGWPEDAKRTEALWTETMQTLQSSDH